MTPLRQRMLEDMQLRAFSARTQEAYVYAVHRRAQHFHKSPDVITDEELRQYFLHLTQVQHYARATVTIALCGITFFIEHTLGKTFTSLALMRPPHERKLPVVLGRAEVWRILSLVRLPVYRACLITLYACGLRLLEGARLQVTDVDSARLLLHIRGKGQYDRYVPLPVPFSHQRQRRSRRRAHDTISCPWPLTNAPPSRTPTAVRPVTSVACTSSPSSSDRGDRHEAHRRTSRRARRRAIAHETPSLAAAFLPRLPVWRAPGRRLGSTHPPHRAQFRPRDTRTTPPRRAIETPRGPPKAFPVRTGIEFNQTLYRGSARQKVLTR